MEIMVELQQIYHKLIDVILNKDINNIIVPLYFSRKSISFCECAQAFAKYYTNHIDFICLK